MLTRNDLPLMSAPSKRKAEGDGLRARQEVAVGTTTASKVMLTATTYMTMMVYETRRPTNPAGQLGADVAIASAATATGTLLSRPVQTGGLHADAPSVNSTSQVSSSRKPGIHPLSETTEHILIAAGAIGVTIVLLFIIYLIYRLRNGVPLRDIFKTFKARQSRLDFSKKRNRDQDTSAVTAPLGSTWGAPQLEKNTWDTETSFAGSTVQLHPFRPNPAFKRPGTSSSNRSLHGGLQAPSVAPFPPPNRRSRSAPPSVPFPPNPSGTDSRYVSGVPSSALLPIEQPDSLSEMKFRTASASLPRPTNYGNGPITSPPKISRFSWTNSQAPKTPVDSRFSMASSTQSMARYRTVESWVGMQAGRLEDQKRYDQLKQHIEETIRDVAEASEEKRKMQLKSPEMSAQDRTRNDSIPTIPELPSEFSPFAAQTVPLSSLLPPEVPAKNGPDREKMVKERHITGGSDAPIFRAHPGTEVRIPRGTFIPSEILDGKISPSAL